MYGVKSGGASILRLGSHAFQSDLGSLGSIVGHGQLAEPRVLEGLSCRDTFAWVINKDFFEKVKEKLQERSGGRDDVLLQCQHPESVHRNQIRGY